MTKKNLAAELDSLLKEAGLTATVRNTVQVSKEELNDIVLQYLVAEGKIEPFKTHKVSLVTMGALPKPFISDYFLMVRESD